MGKHEIPTIALISSNPQLEQRIKTLFQGEGCNVVSLSLEGNLDELLQAEAVDLILCANESNVDTMKFFNKLKSSPDLPIIILLPWDKRDSAADIINSGASDVIYELFSDEELSARVWNHLGLKQALNSLRRREEDLKKLSERLQAEKEDREKLLGIMAHDLKNPVWGISSFLIELTANYDFFSREQVLKNLIELRNSSLRVRDLLMNLLDWARSMTRGEKARLKNVNLLQITDQIVGILDFFIQKKKLKFSSKFEVFQLQSDEDILSAVLRNLISNAIKFTPAGGSIEVTSARIENQIQIKVADTGVGMESSFVKNVLSYSAKKFKQGTDGERGTGLGLKLSKDLVEKLGGSLTIKSEVGQGTIVTISLPTEFNG